ncbi:hypothetical protein B0E45_06250 [Sinorhizobium sp. A49]|uniref:hypothetical protein n=1 Tax=Sinorhizobium sp. A49 TaxID=1945861 RepID=UPI000985BEAD|nr:hypothetical protein [Sinorhizobium sp. A49]OOG73887.1 hypothetical protein B0E45_06250 [Sinorhizobium sp. A49]
MNDFLHDNKNPIENTIDWMCNLPASLRGMLLNTVCDTFALDGKNNGDQLELISNFLRCDDYSKPKARRLIISSNRIVALRETINFFYGKVLTPGYTSEIAKKIMDFDRLPEHHGTLDLISVKSAMRRFSDTDECAAAWKALIDDSLTNDAVRHWCTQSFAD